MKTKLLLFAVACLLLGLTPSASAQNNTVTAELADIIRAMNRQMNKDAQKQSMVSSLLNGTEMGHAVSGLLHQEDFREGLGVSQEQWQRIQEEQRNIDTVLINNDLLYQSSRNEGELQRAFREAVMSNAAPDILKEIQKNLLDLRAKIWDIRNEISANIVDRNLTPEQIDLLYNLFHVFSALIIAQTSFVRNRCLRRRFR